MSIASLGALFLAYKYPIIFLITIIEGPIIMVTSGILLRLGLASLWPLFLALLLGDLAGDVFWYYIGYHFAERASEKFGRFFGITPELIQKTKAIFQNHEKKILFISKITLGFGFAIVVLVVAGMSKMSFKKYIASLAAGQIILTGVLVSIGYFFGNIYVKLGKDLQILALVAFLVIVFLAITGIRSYFRNKNLAN